MPKTERAIADIRLDGGRACLDFVNTIHRRRLGPQEDYLSMPERFLDWSARAGLVEAGEKLVVPAKAARRARLMKDVRALRQAIYALLSAAIDGMSLPLAALRVLERWVHAAWRNTVLQSPSQGRVVLRSASGEAGAVLMRAALDALDVLLGEDAAQVKRCPECGWLFLDVSKNGSRRWCAMETCGAAVKMRRYRRRRG